METERKIEKLLRAYAKKRRADAGDPLKLHPATRRLLQAEVARRKPKPDDEESSVSLWELLRQRWALLAGFAVICFFGAALFLPALNKAKIGSQTAASNLKLIGFAAKTAAEDNNGKLPSSLDALTNQLSNIALTDPESGKPFVYVAGGENLGQLSSNSLLAYSSTDKKGHAALFADGRVEVVNGARLGELTNQGRLPMVARDDTSGRRLAEAPAEPGEAGNVAAAPAAFTEAKSEADRSAAALSDTVTFANGILAANMPASAAPALDGQARAWGAPAKDLETQKNTLQVGAAQNFRNLNQVPQNSFKNKLAPAQAVAVLDNFQVQQNGNALRVVDADGSVYEGALQPEKVVAQNASTEVDRQKNDTSRAEQSALQNNFFRVSGLNQTLKQNVVFTGNLLAIPGTPAKTKSSAKAGFGGSQTQSTLTNQLPWADSRIAGTAIISDTNQIEINAIPQSP